MKTLQQRVEKWVIDCFGQAILLDERERAQRFLEEAIELAQATGLSKQDVNRISEYVYARPVGKIAQEIGGCGVTLLALGAVYGIDIMGEFEREVKRIESIDAEHFRNRNLEKSKAGIASYDKPEEVAA